MHSRAEHVHGVDMKDLLRTEVGPHPLQSLDGTAPLMSFRCEYGGGHSPCRSAYDDLERVTRARP
jgi:hypothetical protein